MPAVNTALTTPAMPRKQTVVEFVRGTGVIINGVTNSNYNGGGVNGPWTFTPPVDVQIITAHVTAGGAGGGGGAGISGACGVGGGAGGASGNFSLDMPIHINRASPTLTITVGAGGAGGPAGAAGAAGSGGTDGSNTSIAGTAQGTLYWIGGYRGNGGQFSNSGVALGGTTQGTRYGGNAADIRAFGTQSGTPPALFNAWSAAGYLGGDSSATYTSAGQSGGGTFMYQSPFGEFGSSYSGAGNTTGTASRGGGGGGAASWFKMNQTGNGGGAGGAGGAAGGNATGYGAGGGGGGGDAAGGAGFAGYARFVYESIY